MKGNDIAMIIFGVIMVIFGLSSIGRAIAAMTQIQDVYGIFSFIVSGICTILAGGTILFTAYQNNKDKIDTFTTELFDED